jgi:copper chaperone CopZ
MRMTTIITVEGMSCDHCERSVEEALHEVSGVSSATADREREQVSVEGDADLAALVRAVENAGYTPSG